MSKPKNLTTGIGSNYEEAVRPIQLRERAAIVLFTLCFLYFSFAAFEVDHGALDDAHAAFYGWATSAGAVGSLLAFANWIRVRSQKFEVMKRFGRFPDFAHKLLAK